jgi:hypothetical protein
MDGPEARVAAMFKFRSTLAVTGLLLITACASDQPPPHPHPGLRADRDDGPGPADRFGARAMLFVSPSGEPFRGKPGEPYPVTAWFRQADANADGHLDRAEFIADAQRFFRQLDVNGDGAIDGLELQNYEHRIVPEILGGPGVVGQIDPPAAIVKVSDIILVQMGGGGGMAEAEADAAARAAAARSPATPPHPVATPPWPGPRPTTFCVSRSRWRRPISVSPAASVEPTSNAEPDSASTLSMQTNRDS